MKRWTTLLLLAALLLGLCVPAAAAQAQYVCSEALVTYLKNEEGFRDRPYNDGTGWYIGYGTACSPADCPDGITEEAADALLRVKLEDFAKSVREFLSRYGVRVNQAQFDALCAMTYNFGPAWLDTRNRLPSFLVNGIENYSDQQIASAFAAWCHVSGEPSPGLLRRRIIEAKLFLDRDYGFTDEGWSWVIFDAAGGDMESDVAVYRSGLLYGYLPAPVSEDSRSFAGWQKADGTLLSDEDTVTENLRLTALWTEPETMEAAESPVPGVFSDVPGDAWYAETVNRLVRQGVVGGYEDGTFRPANPVTWGEALKLVLRAAGYPEQQAKDGAHWASGYADFAVEKRFLSSGAPADLGTAVSRNAVADLCAATLELSLDGGGPSAFADSDRPSVLALYDAGILEGSLEAGQRVFRGADSISRAELCAILARMADFAAARFVTLGANRVAVDGALRPNPYDNSAFYAANNGRVYYDDPARTVRYGIDVSYFQGDIDWNRVAADGIDFAIIRCGGRGYGAGGIYEDTRFHQYMTGALAAGLDVGVYFFSQALTVAEALEEAEYTLNMLRGYNVTFPVVFDWEQITSAGSRTKDPDWAAVNDCIDAFCSAIAQAGYTPMAYFNKTTAYLRLDMSRVQRWDGWLAWYHDYMDFAYDFQMWQYGSSGSVAGIAGDVDMNICFVDYGAK